MTRRLDVWHEVLTKLTVTEQFKTSDLKTHQEDGEFSHAVTDTLNSMVEKGWVSRTEKPHVWQCGPKAEQHLQTYEELPPQLEI